MRLETDPKGISVAIRADGWESLGGMIAPDLQSALAVDPNHEIASIAVLLRWRMTNGEASAFCEYQGDEHREDRFWS